jgi:hypothetical protein
MRPFFAKLSIFFAPLFIAFAPPAFVLLVSSEIKSADDIALAQFEGPRSTVYGPAYTNPDARYKLVGARLRQPRVFAMGSSRALELRADLFTLREGQFYNVGLLTERLHEMRRALAHLPLTDPSLDGEGRKSPKQAILLGLDQWAFNPNWPNATDNPLYEREVGEGGSNVLNALQRSFRPVWSDLVAGKLQLARLLEGGENIGVNARLRGNGFRWDGSYVYADVLADPVHAKDYQFKESLKRVQQGTKRYEFADDVSPAMIEELRVLLADAKRRDLDIVGYLPPYAPTVEHALKAGGKHAYMQKLDAALRPIFVEAGYPFFDFTSCERIGCSDGEFIDGVHPGVTTAARMVLEMAPQVPWLDALVDQDELARRVHKSAGTPELVFPEAR